MKLVNIRKVSYFIRKPWLEGYIDFYTIKRAAAKNAFEKDIFKLINNYVLVKPWKICMRKPVNVKVVTTDLSLESC